jgi:hypothetical protein
MSSSSWSALLVCFAIAVPGAAAADQERAFAVGELDGGGEGTAAEGTIEVRGAAPEKALIVNPFDPDRFLTSTVGACADGECTYTASYMRTTPDPSHPIPVLVLPERDPTAAFPVRIEPSTALRRTLIRAIKRPSGVRRGGTTTIYALGVVDLVPDGTPDVALVTGCLGDSDDGMCGKTRTAVLQRSGKRWVDVTASVLR